MLCDMIDSLRLRLLTVNKDEVQREMFIEDKIARKQAL